jgi:hypothetical protein
MEGFKEQITVIRSKIVKYDYDDVYNMNETGLFYNIAHNCGKTD